MNKLNFLLLLMATVLISCSKDTIVEGGGIQASGCDTTLIPVVMCHGFLASGDTYAGQVKRFVQNNYCGNAVYVYDWNSLGGGGSPALLDAFIEGVLERTGAAQVNLVGHSAGGGVGYDYLSDASRAAKVAHYVHLGSNPQDGPAGPNGDVPTLNIWSPFDAVVAGAEIPDATNLQLAGKDHYEVATSEETFAAMFAFFNDGTVPASTTISGDGIRALGGKVLTLGENEPLVGAVVHVFTVDAATGFRSSSTPLVTYTTNEYGQWGCFDAAEGQHYEFEVTPAETNGRKLHYYREPFHTSDNLVYLRAMPPPSSLAGLLLASLPNNDAQAVVIAFASSNAVIAGRDALDVNGLNLSTPDFASEANTSIAFFLYDNGNAQTDGTPVGLFANFPFLAGVDIFFPTTAPETITLTMNGRTLRVRNWPSETEGITVAVFD